jgi:putative Holliday junction resolvase
VNPERILGVDPGAARVGLALSDEIGMLAHPFRTLAVKGGDCLSSAPEIAAAAQESGASTIVIGLPRNMNGTYGPAADKSRALAAALSAISPARIVLWDERLTTAAASRRLHEAGRNTREQRGMIDRAAAVQILQDWLDSRAFG